MPPEWKRHLDKSEQLGIVSQSRCQNGIASIHTPKPRYIIVLLAHASSMARNSLPKTEVLFQIANTIYMEFR
jgi:hypothetical protein